MKKAGLKIAILLISMVISSATIFFYQMRRTNSLRKEFVDKETRLIELKVVKRKIAEVEQNLTKSKAEEKVVFEKIHKDKESIFDLMRELTILGYEVGFRGMSFSLGDGGSDKQAKSIISKNRVSSARAKKMSLKSTASIFEPYYFKIKVKSGYKELISFSRIILELKRIVSIEEVKILRDEGILPYQRVDLRLITYTFSRLGN